MKNFIKTVAISLRIDLAKRDLKNYCLKLQRKGNEFLSDEELKFFDRKITKIRGLINRILNEGDLTEDIRRKYNYSLKNCDHLHRQVHWATDYWRSQALER